MLKITCGIDWAEKHHDIALVDEDGALVAKARITESVEGFQTLLDMLANAGDSSSHPIPVAIETPRGLLVSALRATGRPIYPINPMAVARYRDRYSASGKKSDHADAVVLANILRTDRHVHRPLPADTELARSITVLARACQDATWRRTRAGNELRSLLREYYPAMLDAAANRSGNLATPLTRALLELVPTPAAALAVTRARVAAALRRAGRSRNVEQVATELHAILRRPQLRQDPLVEQAMGVHALRLLATLTTECASIELLSEAVETAFQQHPDHEIITSFPGIAVQAGARLLGEIGDDRTRFADARSLKAFAGAAPVTRASGRSLIVSQRRIKNNRLAAVGFTWGLSALNLSPGARARYDRRRTAGDGHAAAFRNLFNRLSSRGFDGGKKVNGRKRHIATDTTGLLLVVLVTAASVQDRDAGRLLLWALHCCFPRITKIWADGGYAGQLVDWASAAVKLSVDIVRKLADQVGFHVLPRRWVVERTLSWITRCRRTVRDYERLPAHHATFVQWSMIIVMTRRLARHHHPTPT